MADDTLTDRVAALERAVTDGHADDGLPDAARMAARLDDAESTVAELDDRVAELEATVQALRGFAGGVRAVDEAVERRANDAVARVERLETELRDVEAELERDAERVPEYDAAGPAVDDGSRRDTPTSADAGRRSRSPADTERPEARRRDATTSADARDDPDGLGETVEARSEAALAEMAAETEEREPVDESESASLGERLRRLL